MLILGIETSCDETSTSVVKDGRGILSQVISSSLNLHTKTGGVIPEVAAREQIKAMLPVLERALQDASLTKDEVDALAVTVGPGLIGSLLVGVETAKTLSYVWSKPIIPVNHLPGHLYANWLTSESEPQFPAVGLVVSGGHTDLVLMKNHGEMEWIGGTRDDAAGEAFDKSARLLGLPYPGGPSIAAEAAKFQITNAKLQIKLPRPLLDEKTFDFSFSGLKTAVLREVSHFSPHNPTSHIPLPTSAFAYEVQEAITDVVVEKTLRAVRHYGVSTLLVAGGVAANSRLKEKFEKTILDLDLDLDFRVPHPKLCTDNASFIAACAFFNQKPAPWNSIDANPGLQITDKI